MTLSPASEAAARELARRRRLDAPGPRLPEDQRPHDTSTALAVQRRVSELVGWPVGGWKCSLPVEDRLIVAPLFAPMLHRGSPCPIRAAHGKAQVEPEIAYVLARDLPGRSSPYGADEVRDAIGETRMVLELIGCRYPAPDDVAYPEMLADGSNNQGLWIGPAIERGLTRALEAIQLNIAAGETTLFEQTGRHPNGHPLVPLTWLANFLSEAGDALRAGQIVTTGSYAGVLEVPLSTTLRFRYGDLGGFEVAFAERT